MDFDMFNIPVINLDHYSALGLKREDDPSIEDIQNAYRHLALQWHPERNKTSSKRETASLKFIEINEAYKFLMDKKLREAKQAAKAAKSKKPERALSPIGRATSPGPTSPTGRSKSRPRWSAAASRLVSGMHGSSQSDTTISTEETKPEIPKLEEPLPEPEPEPPRSSFAPSRSTIASPPATHLSTPLSVAPRYPSAPPSREPSPALPGAYAPSSAGRSTASWITTHVPTRANPEARDSRASTVRSPPAVYTVNEDVPTRQPRYLRAMSELGLTDMGSVSGSGSVSGGYASSVVSGSSATTNIPDDWLFPIYLTLEDLYTCKTHRFRINRHLLNGSSKEVFVDVSVQPNWRDGTQLRCKGLGNEREGQPPQDVIFVVKEKLHPRFLRDPMGYDIYARLEVSLVIALGGGSTNDEALLIKGVDGSEIVVEVPPPVVRHGSMTRIKGAGMPKYKSKDGSVPLRGDLILEWCVLPPDKDLSEEAMAELREALGDTWLRDEVDE